MVRLLVGATLLVGVAAPATAQQRDYCADADHWGDRTERHCEVREYSLANVSQIILDGGANGGVTVSAWNRRDLQVVAVVMANARSVERARAIAAEVEVRASTPSLTARGPRTQRRESWHVSWHIFAPAGTNLDLETVNGGIRLTGMTGTTRFRATNGGVVLSDMAGDVSGSTTNGGLRIDLTGSRWTGAGLDVRATNGGVQLVVPADYSGEFETGTVNGRLDLDFPITVQGRFGGRELRFTLGGGGPRIRATTTNGGVRIQRS